MADFLTADELTLIQDDFADLIGDTQVRVSITYKTLTGRGTYNRATQTKTPTFSDSSINAFRAPITEAEEGLAQIGDYRYLIAVADIAQPKKDDRIVDGTNTRFVVESRQTPVPVFHSVLVRDVGDLS